MNIRAALVELPKAIDQLAHLVGAAGLRDPGSELVAGAQEAMRSLRALREAARVALSAAPALPGQQMKPEPDNSTSVMRVDGPECESDAAAVARIAAEVPSYPTQRSGEARTTGDGDEIRQLCALKDREAIAVNLLRYGGLNKHHARAVADAMLGDPVAHIEGADALRLADELEALRQAHWSHWTALENHAAAVAVRHLRMLGLHNSFARNVTADEDCWLHDAAKRSSTLVAEGRLVGSDPTPAEGGWDASQIKQPGWHHVQQAFIDGAREAQGNPTATDEHFCLASDGYTKRVFEEVDPTSEAALRTESWAGNGATQRTGQDEQGPDGQPSKAVPVAVVKRGGVSPWFATALKQRLDGWEELPLGEHTLYAFVAADASTGGRGEKK